MILVNETTNKTLKRYHTNGIVFSFHNHVSGKYVLALSLISVALRLSGGSALSGENAIMGAIFPSSYSHSA